MKPSSVAALQVDSAEHEVAETVVAERLERTVGDEGA